MGYQQKEGEPAVPAMLPVEGVPDGDEAGATAAMRRWPSAHLWTIEAEAALQQDAHMVAMKRSRSLMLAAVEDMSSKLGGDLLEAAYSYQSFGLQQKGGSWTFREWVPNAGAVFLVGDFNGWNKQATPLTQEPGSDVWFCEVPRDQAAKLQKGQKYKVYVEWPNKNPSWYIPSAATRMTYTSDIRMFDAVVHPVPSPKPSKRPAKVPGERIYECHLGLTGHKQFKQAAEVVIPRAKRNGYTALLLIGVQECKSYAMMGAQPCAYFAPCAMLGTPEDLQDFVAEAHGAGLRVYMCPSHEGAAWCDDGLPEHYFRTTSGSRDPISGARLFDYEEPEVVRFLLSNLAYWMVEYGFDGFRFDRVSSVIYAQHGRWLPQDTEKLDEYVNNSNNVNSSAIQYLMLATSMAEKLAQSFESGATMIADDPTLFPGICRPIADGGLGFDLRQNSFAGLWKGLLRKSDEEWTMEELMQGLTGARLAREGEPLVAAMQNAKDCAVSRKPLKIAMLSWETLHTIAVGGVAPHVTELAGALNGAGHEVHIFTRSQGHPQDNEILGVHYHEVGYNTAGCLVQDARNMCGAFVHALNGHESVWGGFDIVHGHDWMTGPGIMELKGQGKRVVFTMHSTEGGRNGDMGKGHPGIKDLERCSCGAADKLICVSGVLKDEVCGVCGADGNRMSVIYNGIHAAPIANMEWEDEWIGNTKADKGFGRMDPMFLFVGRHTAQKGCDLLIEAIPHILGCRGDAKFVIVGDGHLLAHNQGRVHALGVGHAVSFTGSLKSGSAHLKALFKSCDAVVVPSRNEPFGIVVLEAWASGKPVVATTSGGPRDFVKPGEDGYLVDPDPGSIAWGCCKILENFEHSRWMGKNAQAKAIREFSWENIAVQTEQVYYSLLNLEGAPRSNDRAAGAPIANTLLAERCFNMKVEDGDQLVTRGVSLLKLMKLATASLSGEGVMTWMSTEFGQIDPVDMPRPGNGFNDEPSRVKFELADNKDLKFNQLESFESALNGAALQLGWLASKEQEVLVQSEEDKVMVYKRGSSLFVLNWHPWQQYTNFGIEVAAVAKGSKLNLALSTDEARFGGTCQDAAAGPSLDATSAPSLILSVLPPRTGLVFHLPTDGSGASIDALKGA